MVPRNVVILGAALFLGGCTSYEGRYVPDCLAYSGSEIRLSEGRYVWTKFTDQVVVDEHGNQADPFPGFPREGAYTKQGNQVRLGADGSVASATMFIFREKGEHYLYTAEEAEAFEASGARPACPLKLQAPD